MFGKQHVCGREDTEFERQPFINTRMSVNIFFSYIRLFIFLAFTLAGIQVPAFVDQYGKSLEAHLAESRMALNAFQDDADKYFGGSLEKLIAHYVGNKDQVFNEGGRSIQSIYDRNQLLKTNFDQFQHSSWAAYTQALAAPVMDVREEVWNNYSYVIQLKPWAIAFGLVLGLIVASGAELVLRIAFGIPRLISGRRQVTYRRPLR